MGVDHMGKFTLNGEIVNVESSKSLIKYLRDDMKLTSVKNGCNKGVCGTCTVLIDSKPKRACVLTTDKVEGKSIITLEGIDESEKSVYVNAFSKVGAVQCGFCIPGMIIAAKGLIDNNPNPTEEDVKKSIRNNLCRCTGYVKIIEAILLAAKAFNDNKKIDLSSSRKVGESMVRYDAVDKARGVAKYADDIYMEDMLYASVLRLDIPRVKINSIDITKASKLAGVEKILTANDVPGENYQGYIFKDWPTLVPVGHETRYIGDAVALVAASTKEIADEAIKLIEVEYEQLVPITSCEEALKSDAYKIHELGNLLKTTHVVKGDVESAIRDSKFVVEHTFNTPTSEHAFLEPESTISFYDEDVLVVYSSSQSVHHDHHEIA